MRIYEDCCADDVEKMSQAYRVLESFYGGWNKPEAAKWRDKRLAVEKQMPRSDETLMLRAGDHEQLGELKKAERLYRRSVEMAREGADPVDSQLFGAMSGLASFYERTGRSSEAEGVFLELLSLCESVSESHPEYLHNVHRSLAHLYDKTGRVELALVYFENAVELGARQDRDVLGYDLIALGDFYMKTTRYRQALEPYQQALALLEAVHGTESLLTTNATFRLAKCYVALGRDVEAEPMLVRTIETLQRTRGPLDPFLRSSQKMYSDLLRRRSESEEPEAKGAGSPDSAIEP